VEEGLARACTVPYTSSSSCSAVGGGDGYLQFWEDVAQDGTQYYHPLSQISDDGQNQVYEIWDTSNGGNDDYTVYLNDNPVGTSSDQGSSSGVALNAGMELYSPGDNMNESTGDLFHNFIQDYINARGTWAYVDFDPTTTSILPCGYADNCSMDNCSSQPQTACLYWQRTANYEWSDYKPG
jgi:hypothetical protein